MKKIIAALVIIIVAGFVWYYLDTVNQPKNSSLTDVQKKQALSKLLNREAVLDTKKTTDNWVEYKGEYIQFTYPAIADIHQNGKNPPLLDNFQFGIRDPHVNISIQVVQMQNSTDLSEYPAVNLRQNQKGVYTQSSKILDGERGIEFVKDTDGAEKSSFFIHKGRIYSIVGSGFDLRDTDKLYERVLSTMKFN